MDINRERRTHPHTQIQKQIRYFFSYWVSQKSPIISIFKICSDFLLTLYLREREREKDRKGKMDRNRESHPNRDSEREMKRTRMGRPTYTLNVRDRDSDRARQRGKGITTVNREEKCTCKRM